MAKKIEFNCDMGESFGNYKIGHDDIIMPVIPAINVACGFHAGDGLVMKKTVEMAKANGVAVGAHPGFPDLMGFGRREMNLTEDEVYAYTIYQVGALKTMCEVFDMPLHHVKPHGKMYVMMGQDRAMSDAFVQAVYDIDPKLPIYHSGSLTSSAIGDAVKAKGMTYVREFNSDTDYDAQGNVITPHYKPGEEADSEQLAQRVLDFLETGKVKIGSGETLEFGADSICVHGDNPSAVNNIKALRDKLETAGYEIKAI